MIQRCSELTWKSKPRAAKLFAIRRPTSAGSAPCGQSLKYLFAMAAGSGARSGAAAGVPQPPNTETPEISAANSPNRRRAILRIPLTSVRVTHAEQNLTTGVTVARDEIVRVHVPIRVFVGQVD